MVADGPIDSDTAEHVLTLLTSLAQPLTEADARALVSEQHWIIDGELPGSGLIATAPWQGGEEAIQFAFENGVTTNLTVAAYAGSASDPASKPIAIDTFAMLIRTATDLFGERTGEIIAKYPRAWWILPGQTISISRGNNSATIMWATHEDHADLVRSATQGDA